MEEEKQERKGNEEEEEAEEEKEDDGEEEKTDEDINPKMRQGRDERWTHRGGWRKRTEGENMKGMG